MLKRHHQIYIAILVLSAVLMTLQSRYGIARPLWFIPQALEKTNASITYTKHGLRTFARVAMLNEKELISLSRWNLELRSERADYQRLKRENERLRGILEFADRSPGVVAVARVVSRGSDMLANIITIDKGARHGLQKDMTVVVPEGLVGKIVFVDDSYARVLLINDSMFSAAVRLDEPRLTAVYSGDGKGSSGKLKYVSTDQPLEAGLKLSTSGLDALFPPDIAVGVINTVSTDIKELFHDVKVITAIDTANLEEVVIVSR